MCLLVTMLAAETKPCGWSHLWTQPTLQTTPPNPHPTYPSRWVHLPFPTSHLNPPLSAAFRSHHPTSHPAAAQASLHPTPNPTPRPTPRPTPSPSPSPTPCPTPLPSHSPTTHPPRPLGAARRLGPSGDCVDCARLWGPSSLSCGRRFTLVKYHAIFAAVPN